MLDMEQVARELVQELRVEYLRSHPRRPPRRAHDDEIDDEAFDPSWLVDVDLLDEDAVSLLPPCPRCIHCGLGDGSLRWHKFPTGWRLVNPSGWPHVCSAYSRSAK